MHKVKQQAGAKITDYISMGTREAEGKQLQSFCKIFVLRSNLNSVLLSGVCFKVKAKVSYNFNPRTHGGLISVPPPHFLSSLKNQ